MRFTLFLIALILANNVCATTRVAIVSGSSKYSDSVIDLVTAELSSEAGIEILDRTTIRKVLKEQELSLGSADAMMALSVGQLLNADLFAVIEADFEAKKPIGLVVFDAGTGVRYWDSALPEVDLAKRVAFIMDAVKTAVEKRKKASGGKLKYISLVGVRNVNLPRDENSFCEAVRLILMRMLANSPDVAVLDRSYLEYLNKERNLPGVDLPNKLLAATTMLDLEVSRKNDKYSVVALFSAGEQVSVLNSDMQVSVIAEDLAKGVLMKLSSSLSSISPNIINEAKRFQSEYRFLRERNRFLEAHAAIESYHALCPATVCRDLVASLCWMSLNQSRDESGVIESLNHIERALSLCLKWYNPDKPYSSGTIELAFTGDTSIDSLNVSRGTKKRMRDLQQAVLDCKIREHENYYKYKIDVNYETTDSKSLGKYTEFVWRISEECGQLSLEQWLQKFAPLYIRWLNFSAQYADDVGREKGIFSGGRIRLKTFSIEGTYSKEELQGLKDMYMVMARHPSAPVRVAGKRGQIFADGYARKADDEYWDRAKGSIAEVVKDEIGKLGAGNRFCLSKALCYEMVAGLQLFDFMVSRNELCWAVTSDTMNQYWLSKPKRAHAQEGIKRGAQILELCDSPDTVVLYHAAYPDRKSYVGEMRKDTLAVMDRIYAHWPDLKQVDELPWKAGVKELPSLKPQISPIIHNNYLYAVRRREKSKASLMKISIPDGHQEELSQHLVDWEVEDRMWDYRNIRHTLLYNDMFMWGSIGNGVLVFPLSGDQKPFRIDKSSGLPSNHIQSFTCFGDFVFLAVGGRAYGARSKTEELCIYKYDMKTKAITLLSSSARKTKETPFDNINKRVVIRGMVADARRSRIVLLAGGTGIPWKLAGLWSYNVESGKWRKLPKTGSLHRGYLIKKNNQILISSSDSCYTYRIEDDSISLFYHYSEKKKTFPVAAPRLNGICPRYLPPHLITDEYVWSGGHGNANGFWRMSLKEGTVERLLCFAKFYTYSYLDVTKNGKYLVAGDSEKIWIMELKEALQ